MPYPVTLIHYFNTAAFSGTSFGGITTTAPATTDDATNGWNVGTNGSPNYAEMNYSSEVARNATNAWTTAPSASIPNQNVRSTGNGNCWIMGPFNGEFTEGNWIITMSYRANSSANSHTNRIIHRIWTSPTASGQNATLVSSTYFSSSIGSISSTTTRVPFTSSIALSNINLHNEYILFQTYCMVQTAGGNINADMDISLGTMSLVQPTLFVSHSRQNLVEWMDL
jgi:hypothetical protein